MIFPVDDPDWLKALTTVERARLLAGGEGAPADDIRGAKRVSRWRRETGLAEAQLFAARCRQWGLSERGFRRVLGTPHGKLAEHLDEPPEWLRELLAIYGGEDGDAGDLPEIDPGPTAGDPRFLRFAAPLLARASRGLRARLAALDPGDALDVATLLAGLLAELAAGLLRLASRALILEVNIRRMEERLPGESSEERFAAFLDSLGDPEVRLEILATYPVLARQMLQRCQQWVEVHGELFARFLADRAEIIRTFSPDRDPGPLCGLATGLGDRHHGGRTVARATFAGGLRLIYKPRSLALDRRFQNLLTWLDARGDHPPLPRLVILDRGSHGWMELVEPRACTSRDEVERFYLRQGACLALLHALGATDFHRENLIARGEHPVLVDLETLFQPILEHVPAGGAHPDSGVITLLRGGLLPRRISTGEGRPSVDLSGLGAPAEQIAEVRELKGAGTDEMRLERAFATWPGSHHRPRLESGEKEEEISLWSMREPLQQGFAGMYRLLLRHREELLAPAGPIAAFAGDPIRVVLRGTTVYVLLLHAGFHPDFLGNALFRDRLFDRLWLDAETFPELPRIIPHELADLERGDVPRFTTRVDSRDLVTSDGARLPDCLPSSGLEVARKQLAGLSEEDLARQSWLLRASLVAATPREEREEGEVTSPPPPPLPEAPPADPVRLVAAAVEIRRRLDRLSFSGGDEPLWFDLQPEKDDSTTLSVVGPGLYSGLAGIALFYAHLAESTGDPANQKKARGCWRRLEAQLEARPEVLPGIGAYSGWGGLVYAATHLGLLWRNEGYIEQAALWARQIRRRLAEDDVFDLIAGAAGALVSLLRLHQALDYQIWATGKLRDEILSMAVACGDHLLAAAIESDPLGNSPGLAWPAPTASAVHPLTGFSHGAAGIAWALAELAVATGEARFHELAVGALAYERGWFSPRQGGWPDLRQDRRPEGGGPEGEEEWGYGLAWCHGAPGIGLGRLGMRPLLDDPEIDREIAVAIETTLARGFSNRSHCLCHGDLGNLDLILSAGRLTEAGQLAGRILAGIRGHGPRCGTVAGVELPGLLCGLAGIGYGLLRAADPERVPSVLLLELPWEDR